nr:putative ribonuclease H-like domain-containing protein [Tanacetum cinerariifolium]
EDDCKMDKDDVIVLMDEKEEEKKVEEAKIDESAQEEEINYEEVFPPVARIEAIRLFLAYASFMGFMVYQTDIKSAFLYRTIEKEVFVCQPRGFKDFEHPDKVYKVVKALYGLIQAPRAWYETLANYLLENGFQKDLCKAFAKLMKDKYQMSSMGELTFFLGLQVKQKKEGIFISQDKYIAKILRKFRLNEGKSASTLIDTEKPLLKDLDGEDVDVHTYRSMIGSLMCLTSSRPNIIFTLMKDKYQMSSMGELTFFLGLQVKQKKDGIFISQDKYIAKILRKFRLNEGKSASTLIDTEKPLLKDLDGEDVDVHTYRSMIGSLMYLTSSRPDIIFTVVLSGIESLKRMSHVSYILREDDCKMDKDDVVVLMDEKEEEKKVEEAKINESAQFRIPQYLQNEHYAIWEVIEFGDSYKTPPEETGKGPASESSAKKKGRTIVITTKDMQKRRNDVKAIVSHLEFMDVKIKQDDLNQNFLTSLAPEWLIEKGKVLTTSVLSDSIKVSTASIDVAAASLSHDTVYAYIASQSNGSQIKYEDITQIDEDDIEEIDIKYNMALLSMRADRFWKKTSKKITIQGYDVAGFDKSKVECFNCHKMVHFAREYREPRSQDRGKTESYKQADDEVPTEFAFMAKSSSSLENEDSGCSRHMTGSLSYLSEYEHYDGGYVSFGHRGGNITDQLGKFDAKGDEGYFIGYSLSSKAFRVFNKRTKKVEENLHWLLQEHLLLTFQGKDGPGKDVELYLYRSMIGSLMYLTASRLDIMFAVCTYVRQQVTPKGCHLHAIERIFRYLKGHPKLGLWYPKESPFDLVAYPDSDYGGATQDRKSTTGDVASQDVKKDVSSLRYFALLNWFHEAHMEIRNSDAPDGCNVDDPKSSGISNPTATSKVPQLIKWSLPYH